MSRERAKLSYRWKAAVIERWAVSKGRLVRDEETGEPFRVPCCPDCTAQIVDKDGVPLTDADLNRRKRVCPHCRSSLWQADKSGPKRYPLADYVKHRMKGFFDLLIGDEVHEFKGRGSAQGIAAGILADVCGKSLSLTGTLLGGYSSTIFHLLYRFSPEIRTEFGRSDEHRWIQRYGFEEVTVGKPDDDAVEDGRNSRRRSYRKVTRERPGLVPSALFHIIGNTVFLRLADVASGLPDYEEKILVSSMDSGGGLHRLLPAQRLQARVRDAEGGAGEGAQVRLEAAAGNLPPDAAGVPGRVHQGETVFDPRTGDVIVQVPPLSEEKLYPKEKALVDLVAAERLEGRRVLVYVTHTGTRDITGRMDDFLTRHGFRVAVMKADAVAPNRREKWVADKVKEGIDVLICHPRLVQTGLDLIDFPTICWDETDYSVYVVRQASRRSWRIGQTRPVKVVFMSYRNTLQADALKLVAKKMQSSLAVEGGAAGGRACRLRRRRRRHDDGPGPQDRQRRGGGRGRDDGGGVRPGAERRERGRGAAGGRRLEGRRDRAGDGLGQREREWQRPPRRPVRHRADGRACAGQRPPRQRQRERDQRPPRRRAGGAAVALLLGRVHGRGADEAEGSQGQAAARNPVPVRVGDGAGTGEGDGRRGALDRSSRGGAVAASTAASPGSPCVRAFFVAQKHRPSVDVWGLFAFPAPAVAPPQSVKIWRRPRLSARSSRAIMCSMLGRPLPSFQRHTV